MSQPFRLNKEGLINRNKKISFTFNGKKLFGYEGDTIASALIANGIHLVGRSFKYHRPRGIMTSGSEEPNAIIQLHDNSSRTEPNVRATEVEIYEGLVASSQNCWPSVRFDIGGINNFLSPLLPAGFYYKTFMWPASFWEKYEYFIRKSAGLGKSPDVPDPDIYEHKYIHCDVLVIGAGISGIIAAKTAAKNGFKTLLVEEKSYLGGSTIYQDSEFFKINNQNSASWLDKEINEIKKIENLEIKKKIIFFEKKIKLLRLKGIKHNKIILDPGIGFGKNLKHNMSLIRNISIFHSLGFPILVGNSRKRFIKDISRENDTKKRIGGTVSSCIQAYLQGVQILRVHDIKEINQAFKVFKELQN